MYPFYPAIIDVNELSQLLKREVKVIQRDRTKRPHTLPLACKPEGCQKPLWILEDVITWLRSHQETPKDLRSNATKIGAPTKRHRVLKRNANVGGGK